MATMKPDRAFGCLTLRRFAGISHTEMRDGEKGAQEMVNFRPSGDGSLKTRCGYERILTLPGEIRAYYTGYAEGERTLYFLIKNQILKCRDDGSESYTVVGTVERSAGEGTFAKFAGKLYLFDGDCVYMEGERMFTEIEGYVPIYGIDWDPVKCGPIYEAVNYLTPRVRIRYSNASKSTVLYFDRAVSGIQVAVGNGYTIDPKSITLDEFGRFCECTQFAECTEIELVLKFADMDHRSRITGCTRNAVYSDAQRDRIICRNGEDSTRFYISRFVKKADAELSDTLCATTGGVLYFPMFESEYRVGAPILGCCRFYDKMMLFSASGAWEADLSTEPAYMVQVHGTIGCDQMDCAVLCGEWPVTYCGGRLYRWKARDNTRNAFPTEVISEPIEKEMLSIRGLKMTMHYFDSREELWFVNPNNQTGEVRIFHAGREMFYHFRNVPMDMLLPSDTEPIFLTSGEVYTFRDTLGTDDGAEICAIYRSGFFDFGHPEQKKHLMRVFLESDPNGGEVCLRLYGDAGRCAVIPFYGGGEEMPVGIERRVTLGRSRLFGFLIEARGTCCQTVTGITVTARK